MNNSQYIKIYRQLLTDTEIRYELPAMANKMLLAKFLFKGTVSERMAKLKNPHEFMERLIKRIEQSINMGRLDPHNGLSYTDMEESRSEIKAAKHFLERVKNTKSEMEYEKTLVNASKGVEKLDIPQDAKAGILNLIERLRILNRRKDKPLGLSPWHSGATTIQIIIDRTDLHPSELLDTDEAEKLERLYKILGEVIELNAEIDGELPSAEMQNKEKQAEMKEHKSPFSWNKR